MIKKNSGLAVGKTDAICEARLASSLRLPFKIFLSLKIEVIFHFQTNLRSSYLQTNLRLSFIWKTIEVVFHWQQNWGCLPLKKILRSSSINKTIEVVLHWPKNGGCLPFTKKNEVIFHWQQNLVVVLFLVFHLQYKVRSSSI